MATNERQLRYANSSRKACGGPKKGRFHEFQQCVTKYVGEKCNEGFPVTRELIRMKALELPCQIQIPVTHIARTAWCIRMIKRGGLTLRLRTTLALRLPGKCAEKPVKFPRHITKLRNQHM
jgi:hypothetical protein